MTLEKVVSISVFLYLLFSFFFSFSIVQKCNIGDSINWSEINIISIHLYFNYLLEKLCYLDFKTYSNTILLPCLGLGVAIKPTKLSSVLFILLPTFAKYEQWFTVEGKERKNRLFWLLQIVHQYLLNISSSGISFNSWCFSILFIFSSFLLFCNIFCTDKKNCCHILSCQLKLFCFLSFSAKFYIDN